MSIFDLRGVRTSAMIGKSIFLPLKPSQGKFCGSFGRLSKEVGGCATNVMLTFHKKISENDDEKVPYRYTVDYIFLSTNIILLNISR